jgi:hypothetical protein
MGASSIRFESKSMNGMIECMSPWKNLVTRF